MARPLSWLLLALIPSSMAQTVSGERMRADVKFLSSDLLEGRGVGTRGGRLAEEYLATQLAQAGAKPAGGDGTYFQTVPLVGVATHPDATLRVIAGGRNQSYRWLDDFVGVSHNQQAETHVDAEAVFVGHGIQAPEYRWDDYKGIDLRGRVAVMFTNEPTSDDPKFFAGRALTYYGRWTYKFEEAKRRGAVAALLIHTPETAGYGWEVVRNSWGGEEPFVKLRPGETDIAFAGWITQAGGNSLAALAGGSVDDWLRAASTREFRPQSLGVRLVIDAQSRVREIQGRNVAAIIEGTDPELAGQAVVFTAHSDHLGIGAPVDGDTIYNGAIDNATGCAVLLEIARAWGSQPGKPRRSALFLAVTAEEGGLRGSEYYVSHPLIPHGSTVAAFNFDSISPFGRTADIIVSGAERTTLQPLVEHTARRLGFRISLDPHPEQGGYYRSDHFSFARAGIPAFSIRPGNQFLGIRTESAAEAVREYGAHRYHRPADEYDDDWDFSGLEETARFGYLLGLDAANVSRMPSWRVGDEFLPERQKSLSTGGSAHTSQE